MQLVTAGQKLFEKFLMLARTDEKTLSVMLVRDEEGSPMLCVGIPKDNGGFTPLAVLLTARQLNCMEPDFENSSALQGLFEEAREEEQGKLPGDFGTSQNPFFTNDKLAALNLG